MPWSAVIAEERLDFDDNLHLELAASWEKNQQSQTMPTTALQKEAASRRMAAAEVFLPPREVVIERYGCQSLRSSYHSDSFGHSDYKINMIVTSDDCADHHGSGIARQDKNTMARAQTIWSTTDSCTNTWQLLSV